MKLKIFALGLLGLGAWQSPSIVFGQTAMNFMNGRWSGICSDETIEDLRIELENEQTIIVDQESMMINGTTHQNISVKGQSWDLRLSSMLSAVDLAIDWTETSISYEPRAPKLEIKSFYRKINFANPHSPLMQWSKSFRKANGSLQEYSKICTLSRIND